MERTDISAKVNELKKVSLRVLNNALSVMKIIADDDNSITDEIAYNLEVSKENTIKITEWLRKYVDEQIATAQTVKAEINKFSDAYTKGDTYLYDHTHQYEMLADVWFGDTYDESGVSALDRLIKDLNEELATFEEDHIINVACKQSFE